MYNLKNYLCFIIVTQKKKKGKGKGKRKREREREKGKGNYIFDLVAIAQQFSLAPEAPSAA